MHQVLIAGAGSIGERHARCFSQTGRASVAIVDTSQARRDQIASTYGWTAYASVTDALRDAAWSTAVICTPAHTHVDLTLQCLDRALPVLIEKPLAVDTRQVTPLIHRPPSHTPAIGVAYVHRAHPAVAAVHTLLQSEKLGQPLQVVVVQGQHFPTFRPAYASTYYARHETGGGAIQDLLTHMFNTVEWFVGPITRLAADAQHLALPGVQVEDTVNVIARHGQVMASYSLNQHQAPNESVITVVCEKGTVRVELHRNRWRWQTDPTGDWTNEDTPLASRDAWFERQAHAWLDVVEGTSTPTCTLDEAYQTLVANETAIMSARQGGTWFDVKQWVSPVREGALDASA